MSVSVASERAAPLGTANLPGPGSPAWWLPPAVLCAVVGGVPLDRKPLFRDEMATYIFSRLSLAGLWSATRHVDGSMVLYYALMHLTPFASTRPVALRLWSLAAAVLTVAIVARIGASLWQGWVGALAGSVLALNGAFLTAADTALPAPPTPGTPDPQRGSRWPRPPTSTPPRRGCGPAPSLSDGAHFTRTAPRDWPRLRTLTRRNRYARSGNPALLREHRYRCPGVLFGVRLDRVNLHDAGGVVLADDCRRQRVQGRAVQVAQVGGPDRTGPVRSAARRL